MIENLNPVTYMLIINQHIEKNKIKIKYFFSKLLPKISDRNNARVEKVTIAIPTKDPICEE